MAPAMKAANSLGIDVGYVGFWSFFEGINYNLTFNNCDNASDRWNPNKACSSTNVQVGPGVRPYDLPNTALQDAFDAMYGAHDDATVKRVGQQVLANMQSRHGIKITYPATSFPEISLQEIMKADTPENKHWFEYLVRDDAISMYYLARTFKESMAQGKLADVMEGWGSSYPRQQVINYIKAVYDLGISDTGGEPISPPPNSGSKQTTTIKVIVKPRSNDQYIYNMASVQNDNTTQSVQGVTSALILYNTIGGFDATNH